MFRQRSDYLKRLKMRQWMRKVTALIAGINAVCLLVASTGCLSVRKFESDELNVTTFKPSNPTPLTCVLVRDLSTTDPKTDSEERYTSGVMPEKVCIGICCLPIFVPLYLIDPSMVPVRTSEKIAWEFTRDSNRRLKFTDNPSEASIAIVYSLSSPFAARYPVYINGKMTSDSRPVYDRVFDLSVYDLKTKQKIDSFSHRNSCSRTIHASGSVASAYYAPQVDVAKAIQASGIVGKTLGFVPKADSPPAPVSIPKPDSPPADGVLQDIEDLRKAGLITDEEARLIREKHLKKP